MPTDETPKSPPTTNFPASPPVFGPAPLGELELTCMLLVDTRTISVQVTQPPGTCEPVHTA